LDDLNPQGNRSELNKKDEEGQMQMLAHEAYMDFRYGDMGYECERSWDGDMDDDE